MNRFSIYSPLATWKKGQYPVAPFLRLSVGFSSEKDGNVLLSPQLMTEKEVDETVDGLIKELEEFRRTTKKELESILARQLR